MASFPEDLILVGSILKPYGLFGEIKVRPETFDYDRHALLKKVYCRNGEGETERMTVSASRCDGEFWYLKFDDLKTPEAVAHLSGRQLMVTVEDRLELPAGLVYHSELPGMTVKDELGGTVGTVGGVMETGAQEYILVQTEKGEIPLPWNDRFVKRIDRETRTVDVDLSSIRGVLI